MLSSEQNSEHIKEFFLIRQIHQSAQNMFNPKIYRVAAFSVFFVHIARKFSLLFEQTKIKLHNGMPLHFQRSFKLSALVDWTVNAVARNAFNKV